MRRTVLALSKAEHTHRTASSIGVSPVSGPGEGLKAERWRLSPINARPLATGSDCRHGWQGLLPFFSAWFGRNAEASQLGFSAVGRGSKSVFVELNCRGWNSELEAWCGSQPEYVAELRFAGPRPMESGNALVCRDRGHRGSDCTAARG